MRNVDSTCFSYNIFHLHNCKLNSNIVTNFMLLLFITVIWLFVSTPNSHDMPEKLSKGIFVN